ncbi:MAG: HAD family phosphatase [Clostridium sp.]|nr:HAD family phosphatase [Clostridium sp.]
MIKNIVFDIGNVLLEFNPKEYLKSKISEDKIEDVYEAIFLSREWPMLDRGTITEEQAIINIVNRNKENKELIISAFDNWYELLKPIRASVDVLQKLKENKYNVYFLSNFHLKSFKYVTRKFDFFNLFNGGVLSYEEKLLKPEKEIYETLIERYHLKKEETVFIDDTEKNVAAAIRIGINGIVLENTECLIKELKKYNINV